MTIHPRHSRNCTAWFVAAALSCASAAASPPAAARDGAPSGLRKEAAFHLLPGYLRDGSGPPEISAAALAHGGANPMHSLVVRYPTQSGMRCFSIESGPVDKDGNFRFSVDSRGGCPTDAKLVPYRELQQMIARIRACERKREARCVVSDPASSNRKIYMLR